MTGTAPDERQLTAMAAAGDDDAFRLLVHRLLPRLRRWALVRTGDPDDADEVVQRTLIRMHRSLGGFQAGGRLSTWLYRILANAATDLGRERAARRRAAESAWAVEPTVAAGEADGVAGVHARHLADVVREFLVALPERQREVLELVDHQGMRPVEVAKVLEMNPVTVRAHLFKARRTLRERIVERYPELMEGYAR